MIFKPTDFRKETIPKYYTHYLERLQNYDFEGAMNLLEEIFKDERNQKKKENPHEKRGEKDRSLYESFQEMIRQFHFAESLTDRVDRILKLLEESLTGENLRSHRFKPFNGFLFKMSDDEFCSASLDSIHFDSESGKTSRVFGLNHEIIRDADSYPSGESAEDEEETNSDVYDFIYALEEGEYSISYLGETIEGKDLHVHIKLLLFAKMIREIFKELLLNERFAKFPKTFPFYALINSEDCYDYTQEKFLLEIFPPLELESFRENPHFTLYETSSHVENYFSVIEDFLFFVEFLNRPNSKEFQNLLGIADSNPKLKTFLERAALDSLRSNNDEDFSDSEFEEDLDDEKFSDDNKSLNKKIKSFTPQEFVSFFWKLAEKNPSHLETTLNVQNEFFLLPPPEPTDLYEDAIPNIQNFSYNLLQSFLEIPDNRREKFRPTFENALDRMKTLPHPAFKICAMEIETRLKSNVFEDENPLYLNPPEELIDLMIELIRCMPEEFPWFGKSWDFIFEDRLLPLGKKAKRAVPAVIEVMERYDYEDATRNLAPVLYEIGCEDIPPLVHELHKENEFYMEEFYDRWSGQAPAIRWSHFSDRFQHFPEDFARSQTWEDLLYDSEPGFLLYYENIKKETRIFPLLLTALKNDPKDVLKRFALFYSDKIGKAAKKNREQFFQIVSDMTELLNLLKPHMKLNREQKFALECGISAKAIESFLYEKPDTLDLLDRTLSEIPQNHLLFFLKVNFLEKKKGIKRAMEELRLVLPILWEEDLVMTKAFFLYLLFPDQNWERISFGKLYTFYKKAQTAFQDRFFADGKFVADLNSFKTDLFSDILKKEYSKIEIELQKTRIQNQTQEYETLEKLDSLPENELVFFLKPGNLSLNLSIASKLLKNSQNFSKELLQLLDWETEVTSVFPILKLYYQNPVLKEELFQNPIFQKHLAFFIKEYKDVSPKELAKSVFSKLKEIQNSSAIVEAVKGLDPGTIVHCFLSVYWAFQNENKLNELESITDQILKKSDFKKPEYVLIAANLGVLQTEIGDLNKAKQTFDSLFSMDWSRFDYQKDETSSFMEKILGGDLDESYSKIFKKYFALAKFNAACLYSRLGDAETCVSYLKETIRLDPDVYDKQKILSEKDFSYVVSREIYQEFLNSLN
ncbi:anaphase-promoting complex subunit 5 domain protein [Leptospira weilii serovar Ranarum str. ICFT]|uniref:Anaphase-promoting complex subunit 5 domain protein n=1 Tax=Leptospira weilii serovar Ranarum str. ICFT TaxID=1218598 RepID=N1WFU6_9LEPT|nr:anaphase-promoting complex subunit 5 domain protein [Leptospira weilii]EMY75989.1 anaphase-promoting complex subunit 5 domain protein [Leptospira weilii serovar Ranarum str. ICFT]